MDSIGTSMDFIKRTDRISGNADYPIWINFLSSLASNKILSFLELEFNHHLKPENPSLNGFIIDHWPSDLYTDLEISDDTE